MRTSVFRIVVVAAVVAVGATFLSDSCLACPNCKDALAGGSGETMNVARGYALSILIMLGMPFTLAGSFGLYVWREMRRLKRESSAEVLASSMQPSPMHTQP